MSYIVFYEECLLMTQLLQSYQWSYTCYLSLLTAPNYCDDSQLMPGHTSSAVLHVVVSLLRQVYIGTISTFHNGLLLWQSIFRTQQVVGWFTIIVYLMWKHLCVLVFRLGYYLRRFASASSAILTIHFQLWFS